MQPPATPKIYHIVHVDRLGLIASDGALWCDAALEERMQAVSGTGTSIGMSSIKGRRLRTRLGSHPDLAVGRCVPFYFCPRSVMLYVIDRANHPELSYRGGQEPIIHLEADLRRSVAWAEKQDRRWAFTLSNAGSSYFEDRADLSRLDELDWQAIDARDWRTHKEGKQAEFLVERYISWWLIDRIGVFSEQVLDRARAALRGAEHQPRIEVVRTWYY